MTKGNITANERPAEGPWVDIDLDALCANYAMIREAAPDARLAAAVKCDAYGLGAGPVARALARRVVQDVLPRAVRDLLRVVQKATGTRRPGGRGGLEHACRARARRTDTGFRLGVPVPAMRVVGECMHICAYGQTNA